MARMVNPPHPGLTLRDDVLPALGLSVTRAAQQLDVSRVALSRVLNGRAAISPEMALRIEAWLGGSVSGHQDFRGQGALKRHQALRQPGRPGLAHGRAGTAQESNRTGCASPSVVFAHG